MIDSTEIIFDPSCRYDDAGRVFYARGRVFRAVNACAQSRILEFLNSELCHYLIENKLLVNTWISDEVILPGYPLVLEHERVLCSRFQEWSFEMKKMVAIAATDLIEISNRYGYTIKDPVTKNFTISCGKTIFFDFGSFVKKSFISEYKVSRFVFLSHFFPLILLKNNVWYSSSLSFDEIPFENSPYFEMLQKTYINGYQILVVFRQKHFSFSTHLKFIYDVIPLINSSLRKCFPKALGNKKLMRRIVIYKKIGKREINKIKNPFEKMLSKFPIEESSIIDYANKLITEDGLVTKTVLCIGNFGFEELSKLQNHVENVNLMTHDSAYIDTVFKSLMVHPERINPLCGKIVELHCERDVKKREYGGGLVIVQDQFDILSRVLHPSYQKYAIVDAIASYCQEYLLIPSKIDPEFINLIEEQFTICHSMTHLEKKYRLFKKKSF